jgi:hypothetical protein
MVLDTPLVRGVDNGLSISLVECTSVPLACALAPLLQPPLLERGPTSGNGAPLSVLVVAAVATATTGELAAYLNAFSASSRWSKLYFVGVCTVMIRVWTDTAGGRPVRVPHRVKGGDCCVTVVCWQGRLHSS